MNSGAYFCIPSRAAKTARLIHLGEISNSWPQTGRVGLCAGIKSRSLGPKNAYFLVVDAGITVGSHWQVGNSMCGPTAQLLHQNWIPSVNRRIQWGKRASLPAKPQKRVLPPRKFRNEPAMSSWSKVDVQIQSPIGVGHWCAGDSFWPVLGTP